MVSIVIHVADHIFAWVESIRGMHPELVVPCSERESRLISKLTNEMPCPERKRESSISVHLEPPETKKA